MLRLRLFASWLLLAVVSFSVVPKDALHGFVHEERSHANAPDSARFEEVCALCSPSALLSDLVPSGSDRWCTLVFVGLVLGTVAQPLRRTGHALPVRGPPAALLA